MIVSLAACALVGLGLIAYGGRWGPRAFLVGALPLAGAAVWVAAQLGDVTAGRPVTEEAGWVGELGLRLELRLDGLAATMSLIVTVVGVAVLVYASRYFSADARDLGRLAGLLVLFAGAMLGLVQADHVLVLYACWELTSITSFLLIGNRHTESRARAAALHALLVTGAGGLALLGRLVLLAQEAGSYRLSELLAHTPDSGTVTTVGIVLVIAGALTKSAQYPFHAWLPGAMAAPTPVSAYLHSATMVKAGVFLLARFWPVLSGTDEWFWIIGGAGLVTLVLGAYAAIFQQDMKGVLAYSTISHLGLITLLLGLNSSLALVAAIFHMVNHATFKASLFMAAGIVDHETGTRDLTRLSGLHKAMPITAALAMVAAASMAGVPLLNGFISKEMFFAETTFVSGDWLTRTGLPLAATVAGAFSVAYSLRFILQVFFGPPATDLPRAPHEPPRWMLFPSALLVFMCLVVGILPGLTVGPFLATAARSILGADMPEYSLAVWHGINLPLIMSVVAMTAGVVIYLALRAHQQANPGRVPFIYRLDGRRSFEALLDGSSVAASWLLRRLATSRLQVQMLLIVLGTLFVAWLPLRAGGWFEGGGLPQTVDPVFLLLWVVGGTSAVAAAYQAKYHRLASLALAGAAGLVTCLTFVWFSAPDLALTQLSVEVVTLVLLLLGLRWLPRRIEDDEPGKATLRARSRRLRDLAVAIAAGAGMAGLAYAVLSRPQAGTISSFFVERALPDGGGTNVVNVILVDFRGFDTFGEITVLGIVALTVYALLRRFRPAPESADLPRQQLDQDGGVREPPDIKAPVPRDASMMVPAVLVRLLLPTAALISVYFLLRGHNQPGGGFVGGLIFATSVILQYMAGGVYWVESRSRLNPQNWIGTGLILAGGAAVAAWFAYKPFLSALAWDVALPLVGHVHVSSVLVFDLGVYMLVVGATVLVLVALAHQSLRAQRKAAAESHVPAVQQQTGEA